MWVASTPLTSPFSSWKGMRKWRTPTRRTWLSNRTGTFIWPRVCSLRPSVKNSTSVESLMEMLSKITTGVSKNQLKAIRKTKTTDGNILALFWIRREWNIVTATIAEVYSTILLLFLFYRAKHVKPIFTSSAARMILLLRSKFGFQFSWLHWRAAFPPNHYIFLFLMLSVTITTTSCLGLLLLGCFNIWNYYRIISRLLYSSFWWPELLWFIENCRLAADGSLLSSPSCS